VRILIVDDHEIVREGLRLALAADDRYEIVGTAHDGQSALDVARRTLPDVALVDLRLPDTSGDELCRQLRERFPSTGVVILTAYLSEGTVRACLEAGALEYVTKAAGLPELRAALDRVARERAAPSATAPQIVAHLDALVRRRAGYTRTTPRQEHVLELVAEGLNNVQIAERLFIAESTVRFHIQKLKTKLNARSKTELIAKALRTGVISPAAEAAPDDYLQEGARESQPHRALAAKAS
jgi:DNA-binding NarL/FixJ family response regulator